MTCAIATCLRCHCDCMPDKPSIGDECWGGDDGPNGGCKPCWHLIDAFADVHQFREVTVSMGFRTSSCHYIASQWGSPRWRRRTSARATTRLVAVIWDRLRIYTMLLLDSGLVRADSSSSTCPRVGWRQTYCCVMVVFWGTWPINSPTMTSCAMLLWLDEVTRITSGVSKYCCGCLCLLPLCKLGCAHYLLRVCVECQKEVL